VFKQKYFYPSIDSSSSSHGSKVNYRKDFGVLERNSEAIGCDSVEVSPVIGKSAFPSKLGRGSEGRLDGCGLSVAPDFLHSNLIVGSYLGLSSHGLSNSPDFLYSSLIFGRSLGLASHDLCKNSKVE
jgi:hypothetical protein